MLESILIVFNYFYELKLKLIIMVFIACDDILEKKGKISIC